MPQFIPLYFVAAAAYFAAAMGGLQLAIPPGFASAVWPAAGVALALLHLNNGKRSVLLGILTGSCLANLTVSTHWFSEFSLQSAIPPMVIGAGAAAAGAGGGRRGRRARGLHFAASVCQSRSILLETAKDKRLEVTGAGI